MNKTRLQLAIHLARLAPGLPVNEVAEHVERLAQLASRTERIAIRQSTDADYTSDQATASRDKIRKKANAILGLYFSDLEVELSGDPRGAVFKIKGIEKNGFGDLFFIK